jgi:hypothetical protein
MGTVVEFRLLPRARTVSYADSGEVGDIVIFPGVRIERSELDLGHRVRNSAGSEDFDDLGPSRPRKSC